MKDTLAELKHQFNEEMVLIVGDEVFKAFPQWKEPATVLGLANVLIIQRTENPIEVINTVQKCGITDAIVENSDIRYAKRSRWIKTMKINALHYSATKIRENLAKAWKTGGLTQAPQGIQRSVWLLIKENQLYAVN